MIKSLIRTFAFTSNWTALVVRQPSTLLWMIAGPFLILFLFGIGNVIYSSAPISILAVPSQNPDSSVGISPEDLSSYLNIVEVTNDRSHAMAELRAQRAQLVLVMPERPLESVMGGKRAVIEVFINEIDPIRLSFVEVDIRSQMALVNDKIEGRVIDMAKRWISELDAEVARVEALLRIGGVEIEKLRKAREDANRIRAIPTEVLAAPFEAKLQNVAPVEPTVINFFVPAAIALVIQHLAVTLAGLSMMRARLLGTLELWRTAPVRLGEIIAGNYLSYTLLILVASAVLIIAITWALGLPVLGSWLLLALSVLLLVLAALGYGFVISLIATNEQTAAQISMIILLASVFLGGFIRPLESITFPVRAMSYLLPATYEGQILQSIMVRGEQGDPLFYVVLGVMAILGIIATVQLLRRELSPT